MATKPQAGVGGHTMAYWERTILPDLHERMKLPCGTFCDLDIDVAVAAARHVSSARYAPLGVLDRSRRERERSVTDAVDEVARRRIHPLPRGRVLAKLIANPVPPRAAELDAHRGSVGFPGEHPPVMIFLGGPVTIGGEIALEVILGPVAKRARAVVSARTPAIGREHDWAGTSG